MDNITIKIKLLIISFLIGVGGLCSILFFKYSLNNVNDYKNLEYAFVKLENEMLTLRRNEKDFLMRNDLKYIKQF